MKTNEKVILLIVGAAFAGVAVNAAMDLGGSHAPRRPISPEEAARRLGRYEEEVAAVNVPVSTAPDPGTPSAGGTGAPEAPEDPVESAPPVALEGVGAASVTLTWEGDPPPPLPPLSLDPAKTVGCCDPGVQVDPTNRSRVLGPNGGVGNVVVLFRPRSGQPAPTPPAEPVVIDQNKCRFEPHIAAVPVGTTLHYVNSDSVNHNVHTSSKKNASLNKNVASQGVLPFVVEYGEPIKIACDIHPWMNATVYATEDWSAVTDETGTASLEVLPAGTYRVSWWHESGTKGKLGDIEVRDGETAELSETITLR